MADTTFRSIILVGSTLASLLEIERLSAVLNPVVGAGPGQAGAF
jgi:hypothetical protein